MDILAWLVLGAIAGYLGGLIVKGDEDLGIPGHIGLGILGALLGGFASVVLLGVNPIHDSIDLGSIVAAVVGTVAVVIIRGLVMGKPRTGGGLI
jgi:uncharacterized membrane protein YeaQ/YmgE (transglycosylase-associated protein family)